MISHDNELMFSKKQPNGWGLGKARKEKNSIPIERASWTKITYTPGRHICTHLSIGVTHPLDSALTKFLGRKTFFAKF